MKNIHIKITFLLLTFFVASCNDFLDENPNKRYISDGVEGVTTVPKLLEGTVDSEKLGDSKLYIYEEEE